jgi:hypothetical protein
MTFYEAALRVLEEAGSPLLSAEITKRSVEKGLLSHIGKAPEVTMLARLAAMAKRPRDRRLMVTAKDTFALTDWMLDEDAEALAQTGVVEPHPEESLPPLRPTERHPEPRADYLRAIGRQGDRKRRGDDEGRRRKYPPIAEVVFELLGEANTALAPAEILGRMRARELASDELSANQVIESLADDNQKRLDQSRRPQFSALRAESGELQISLEPETSELAPLAVQESYCKAAGLTFENGRVVLRNRRGAPVAAAGGADDATATPLAASPEDAALIATARSAAKDARRAMARVLRKKLSELELSTFEKASVRLMHALHFRELKVAKRSKDGPLLTARKKEGSLELRYVVRLLKGAGQVERRHVQELRRDLGHYGAHLGLIISAGEARGDARTEALGGGALVMLWAGDALSERFFEAEVGVTVARVELFDIDEAFFEQARVDGEEAQKRREERHREKEQRDGPASTREEREAQASGSDDEAGEAAEAGRVPAATPTQAPAPASAVEAQRAPAAEGDDEGDEGDDEGPEEGGAEGAPAEGGEAGEGGRRRRRRRRRRRSRGGARPDGAAPQAPAAEGGEAAPAVTAPADAGPVVEAAAAPAPAPEPAAEPPAGSTEGG